MQTNSSTALAILIPSKVDVPRPISSRMMSEWFVAFLRKIVKGGADQSFGIEVAKLAGVPDSVVKRAKVILKELEANSTPIEFTAENVSEDDEQSDIQYNFTAQGTDEILEILKATDINSITPMEALQTLFDLKQKAQELE